MQTMSGLMDRFFRWIFLAIFVAIVATGLLATWPKYRQSGALERERQRLEDRIAAKTAEIEAVKEKQSRFKTDRDFVEALARENRRVFPGELVFIFEK